MNNLISREELLKKVNDVIKNGLGEQVSFSAGGLKFLIDLLPSVDVVEIVRCKDCKHYYCGACVKIYSKRSEDFFCGWGEKE